VRDVRVQVLNLFVNVVSVSFGIVYMIMSMPSLVLHRQCKLVHKFIHIFELLGFRISIGHSFFCLFDSMLGLFVSGASGRQLVFEFAQMSFGFCYSVVLFGFYTQQ